MEPTPFRSLVQQHLLPLFSGAQLVPGTSHSPPQRPAVAERGRQSIEIKPLRPRPGASRSPATSPSPKPFLGR